MREDPASLEEALLRLAAVERARDEALELVTDWRREARAAEALRAERDAALARLAHVERERDEAIDRRNEATSHRVAELERERDAALARVAALEALLAEPSEEEAERLCDVYDIVYRSHDLRDLGTRACERAGVRAILADLRRRAGVGDE